MPAPKERWQSGIAKVARASEAMVRGLRSARDAYAAIEEDNRKGVDSLMNIENAPLGAGSQPVTPVGNAANGPGGGSRPRLLNLDSPLAGAATATGAGA